MCVKINVERAKLALEGHVKANAELAKFVMGFRVLDAANARVANPEFAPQVALAEELMIARIANSTAKSLMHHALVEVSALQRKLLQLAM